MQEQVISSEKVYRQSKVSSAFLLRVSGLPIDVVDHLRFDETVKCMTILAALEDQLLIYKEDLVDMLHRAVQKHKEQQDLRRKLINFKRDVFNMRMSTDAAKIRGIAHSLLPEEQLLIQQWLDIWELYTENRTRLTETFTREICQKRMLFKSLIALPDFRKGVLLASPLLDRAIDTYINSDNLSLNREARTVERSLVEYLQRTACKTSPFSTFTSVSVGYFVEENTEPAPGMLYEIKSMEKRSFVSLNLALLSRVSSLILASSEIWRNLPIQGAHDWSQEGNRIKYVRRQLYVDENIDEEEAVTLDIVHEEVFYLPLGRCLSLILDLLPKGQTLRIGELITYICHHPRYHNAEKAVEAYIRHLLRLDFLSVPALQLNIHSPRILGDYCQALRTIESPLIDRLMKQLQSIERLIDTYTTASIATRRELLVTLRQQVQEIYMAWGQPGLHIPRTLLYEDTVIYPEKLEISEQAWQEVLSDLEEFQQLLPVFDMVLPKKLVTRGYFQSRYGVGQRCDDFLSFADNFNQDFFEQYTRETMRQRAPDDEGKINGQRNHFHIPEIDMLNDTHQAITTYIQKAFPHFPMESNTLILGSDFFETISALLPVSYEAIKTHSFFSQFVCSNQEPLLVINHIYVGLTQTFSRFAHYFSEDEGEQLVSTLQATLLALQPPNTVFAELKGAYDATNLNLHPQVTAYELVCPGEISSRPEHQQIPLTDIFIQDDELTGRLHLYSKRLGKEIIPVYLGFLMPMMLPQIQQVLLNFSYATMCSYNFWPGVNNPHQQGPITRYPRLCYKHLVLQRAMWKIPVEAFPHRISQEADVDFYLRVNQWYKKNDLPSRFFLSSDQGSDSLPTANVVERNVHIRKPMYIDLESYFSVALLESTLRKVAGQLILSEMLPHRDDLWLKHDGQSYVSELVLEVNSMTKEKNYGA